MCQCWLSAKAGKRDCYHAEALWWTLFIVITSRSSFLRISRSWFGTSGQLPHLHAWGFHCAHVNLIYFACTRGRYYNWSINCVCVCVCVFCHVSILICALVDFSLRCSVYRMFSCGHWTQREHARLTFPFTSTRLLIHHIVNDDDNKHASSS